MRAMFRPSSALSRPDWPYYSGRAGRAPEVLMSARVVVALLDERQDYSQLQAAEAKAAAAKAGVSVDVVYAENNALVQIQQLYSRIHAPEGDRPEAIVVQSVTGEGLERIARNAVRSKIGWVLLNRRVEYVDELREAHPELPIARVSFDQVEVGRIQGRQVRKLAPEPGLLIYVSGPRDTSAAQDRLQGTEKELEAVGYEWKVLNGNRTEQGAEAAMNGFLRLATNKGRRPVMIVAQNDWMAMGARRAGVAHDPSWSRVPVVGCDGLVGHGQALVTSGQLAATVVTPSSAGAAVGYLAKWFSDREPLPANVVLTSRSFPEEGQLEGVRTQWSKAGASNAR
jgi:ABC-type sugar transport system substrate-binding protein